MTNEPNPSVEESSFQQRLASLLARLDEQGLTQQQVAMRAGLPPQYLSDIKHGRRPMTELVARRLAEEFDINYQWLLGTSDSMSRPHAGGGASADRTTTLPVFPHPIEGEPRLSPHWDGSLVEIAGVAAAQLLQARQPYILRFDRDDVRGRLRQGDLILVSQLPCERAEMCVVEYHHKLFLARREEAGWERVAAGRERRQPVILPRNSGVKGHCLGIVWASLCPSG